MFKRFALAFLLAAGAMSATAQNLPSFPKDPGILYGALPNGIVYYVCPASDPKGKFDCAVIRRDSTFNAVLAASPLFGEAPYMSFAKMGADALAPSLPGAFSCLLTDVPSTALDSTLLLVTSALSASDGAQAVVIAGDVDSKLALDHLRTLTMLIPARDPSGKPAGEAGESAPEDDGPGISFSFDRTPREHMGGALPYINRNMALGFLEIARSRLQGILRERDIPYTALRCEFYDNTASTGDQKVRISLESPDREGADAALEDVTSSFRANGVSGSEFEAARMAAECFGNPTDPSNRGRLRKCCNSYLFGSDLASAATVQTFFNTRKLSPEKACAIFNRFASGLVGDGDSLFRYSREMPSLDTILNLDAPKQKIRITSPDPTTGGKYLRFQNGIKVLHRNCGPSGRVEFAAVVRGGRSQIQGISPAESEFAGEMLCLGRIAGVDAQDFLEALRGLGIRLTPQITDTDLRITGSAPSDRLGLALRALAAMMTRHECASPEELDYYRRCRMLEKAPEYLLLADSLSRPGYSYCLHADASAITPGLPEGAERFVRSCTASMNEGLLTVMGDVDENDLEETLSTIIGLFPTSRIRTVRPTMSYREASGTAMTISETGERMVFVQYSAESALNAEKSFCLKLCGEMILRNLKKTAAPLGYGVEVHTGMDFFPVDRMVLSITLRPVSDGLPEGVVPAEALDVLTAVSRALDNIMSGSVSGLADAVKVFGAETENALLDPGKLTLLALERYSSGKDFAAKYKETLKYINDGSVNSVLSSLREGAQVRYVSK